MSDDFDPTPYVRPPIIDVPTGVALATSLLSAVPKNPPDSMRKAAQKVRKATIAIQQAWAKSDASGASPDRRKADMRTDNAWGIFIDRLEAYASLPVEHYSRAERARTLVDAISPERGWLKLMYEAQWAESERRIEKIDTAASRSSTRIGMSQDINHRVDHPIRDVPGHQRPGRSPDPGCPGTSRAGSAPPPHQRPDGFRMPSVFVVKIPDDRELPQDGADAGGGVLGTGLPAQVGPEHRMEAQERSLPKLVYHV
jgi:hypothetical protein